MIGVCVDKTRRLLIVMCGWLAAGAAWGGPQASEQGPGPVAEQEPLRAEVRALSPRYDQIGPIWMRFTLINASDKTVMIELDEPAEALGVGLPAQLIFGDEDLPALRVTCDDEAPLQVIPPEAADTDEQSERGRRNRRLRLAPHAVLGADIDLRTHHQPTRYAGTYRIAWSPLAGRLGPAVATFRVEARQQAIFVTDYGKMTFDLMYDTAPLNVARFLQLARGGFYDRTTFHRVIPGFIIQGGRPEGTKADIHPDGETVPAEFSADIPMQRGTLAMARKYNDPHSASCQFFIVLDRAPNLDGEYTVIGQADDEESMRTLGKLAAVPTGKQDRPVDPLRVNSVNLVPVDQPRVQSLKLYSDEAEPVQKTDGGKAATKRKDKPARQRDSQ